MFEKYKKRQAFKSMQKKGKRRAEEAERLRRQGVDVCITHKWRPAIAVVMHPSGIYISFCADCYYEHNRRNR